MLQNMFKGSCRARQGRGFLLPPPGKHHFQAHAAAPVFTRNLRKNVASAILADVEPGFPPAEKKTVRDHLTPLKSQTAASWRPETGQSKHRGKFPITRQWPSWAGRVNIDRGTDVPMASPARPPAAQRAGARRRASPAALRAGQSRRDCPGRGGFCRPP